MYQRVLETPTPCDASLDKGLDTMQRMRTKLLGWWWWAATAGNNLRYKMLFSVLCCPGLRLAVSWFLWTLVSTLVEVKTFECGDVPFRYY